MKGRPVGEGGGNTWVSRAGEVATLLVCFGWEEWQQYGSLSLLFSPFMRHCTPHERPSKDDTHCNIGHGLYGQVFSRVLVMSVFCELVSWGIRKWRNVKDRLMVRVLPPLPWTMLYAFNKRADCQIRPVNAMTPHILLLFGIFRWPV